MGRIGNIKDRKAKQDSKRAQIYTKLARLITVAAREGGTDLEYNASLKNAVDKARAQNMPRDNIARAINKASVEHGDSQYERLTYEGYGPSGVAVIVDILTDNRNRTAGEVRHAFDKNGGNLGTSGCVSFMFEKKGELIIEKRKNIDEENLMIAAIDAGAEDFIVNEDTYQVITESCDFEKVKTVLGKENYSFVNCDVVYIPQTLAKIDEANAKKMVKLIDMLEDNDDVQDIHHNWSE
ncbi:MAG: YebC/PmpR family DNA-binding transcriptional regulator [Alkaliphilus sp.]|nr:MAG: YebC/PmpR family DNA-binding transcriptional regulator [Alkaliphilus sp.]